MAVSQYALCNLNDVRNYLKIPLNKADDQMDNQLEVLIDQMTAVFESYCERKFASRSYTEYHDGNAEKYLFPKHYPIISVTSIHDDSDWNWGADKLVDSTTYRIQDERVIVLKSSLWSKDEQNVKITYVAGYATIPAELKLACIEEVARKYKNRNEIDVLARTAEDGSITKYAKDLLPSTKAILIRYMRVGVV